MIERSRGVFAAAIALVMILSALVAGAWACVPQSRLVSFPRGPSGLPGTAVTVNGLAFDPGPVEIRWNVPDGPRLATGSGPDFSVTMTVPTAPAGLYAVIVLSRSDDGAIGSATSAAFQVTGTGDPPTDASSALGAGTPATVPTRGAQRQLWGTVAVGSVVLVLGVALGVVLQRRRPLSER